MVELGPQCELLVFERLQPLRHALMEHAVGDGINEIGDLLLKLGKPGFGGLAFRLRGVLFLAHLALKLLDEGGKQVVL
ncbi:hypothetical protein N3C64_03210 [Sedimentimonas flavescens]|nr:hypothetical protein [Sedimentimonas flavescens]